MTTPMEPLDQFDEESLRRIIQCHWSHHAPCNSISVEVNYRPDRADWNILIAPAFQKIVGGSQDGTLIWSGFDFGIANFLKEPEFEVDVVGMASYCIQCSPTPFIEFKGRFKGKPFFLRISLEPIPDTKPLELVDAIRNQVRPVEKESDQ